MDRHPSRIRNSTPVNNTITASGHSAIVVGGGVYNITIETTFSTATTGASTSTRPFVDYASRDLHLQSGSPALDKALSAWSETSDADMRSRPQGAAPDIGAFER
jgi:hypothetical protein